MHHANLLIGSPEWGKGCVDVVFDSANPDVSLLEVDRCSIAHVHTLVREAAMRPVQSEYRTFVISCGSLLHEAQNALLKIFEEPQPHVRFYLIIPREDTLLPTLRSRLFHIGTETRVNTSNAFSEFLAQSPAVRLEHIVKRLQQEDDAWVYAIIEGFVAHAHVEKRPTLMADALFLASYIYTPGCSKKMLLEHTALSL